MSNHQDLTTTTLSSRHYWSCRRGMLELDLVLVPFYRYCYPQLSPILQQQFIELLTANDPEIYAWITGRSVPEQPSLQGIVKLVYDYAIDPTRPREF